MTQFVEIPASKASLSGRKKVHGVGINDAPYITELKTPSARLRCPYYVKWASMIKRCYSKTNADVTYSDCYVCDEWLTFSNFKAWMEKQDWQDKQLDKDILFQGNKEYSPDKCLFVTQAINLLLNDKKRARGEYMLGVERNSRSKGKYIAYCGNNRKVYLGSFYNEIDAHNAYKNHKYALIAKVANEQKEPLRTALLNYKIPKR